MPGLNSSELLNNTATLKKRPIYFLGSLLFLYAVTSGFQSDTPSQGYRRMAYCPVIFVLGLSSCLLCIVLVFLALTFATFVFLVYFCDHSLPDSNFELWVTGGFMCQKWVEVPRLITVEYSATLKRDRSFAIIRYLIRNFNFV
jgi:hypothetical protein